MRLSPRLSLLPVIFLGALTLPAQSSSSFDGKWVFIAEKSIYSPGPLPKSETMTIVKGTTTVEGVSAHGQPFLFSFTPVPGKPVPVNGGHDLTVETNESGDTIVHMWSDHSGTSYGNGQISADGKTLRYVLIGSRWGTPVYEVTVFERQ